MFIAKVFELYDTIQVRHGLMLVGPTGGGKSSNWKVLQHAISHLAATEENSAFTKVNVHALNPKSIRMGQLYGEFNDMTREWTDGILANLVRESVKDLSGEKHWIMFDGPVDAVWIESMNTVLDDNKKLCLNSGQILTLTPYMTMMFEVEDLSQASPATVSRCGMVYMEPVALGIQPIIDSWYNTVPKAFMERKGFKPTLVALFEKYFEKTLHFLRKNLKELVETIDNNLVVSILNIMNCFFKPLIETEINKVMPE
jgi:dynein heavy chain, axonemal